MFQVQQSEENGDHDPDEGAFDHASIAHKPSDQKQNGDHEEQEGHTGDCSGSGPCGGEKRPANRLQNGGWQVVVHEQAEDELGKNDADDSATPETEHAAIFDNRQIDDIERQAEHDEMMDERRDIRILKPVVVNQQEEPVGQGQQQDQINEPNPVKPPAQHQTGDQSQRWIQLLVFQKVGFECGDIHSSIREKNKQAPGDYQMEDVFDGAVKIQVFS